MALRSRGTAGSEDAVASGDTLGVFDVHGYDGDSWERTANIRAKVDGTVADEQVPSRLEFLTTNASGTIATRMTIKGSGNVGIGADSPSYLLEVHNASNAVNLSDILFVSGQTGRVGIGTDSPSELLEVNDTTNAKIVATTGSVTTKLQSYSSGSTNIGVLGTESTHNFYIRTDNMNRITILTDGKVGIGDTTPDAPLEINSTTSPQFRISHTDGVDYADFSVDSDGNLTINSSSGNVIIKLG